MTRESLLSIEQIPLATFDIYRIIHPFGWPDQKAIQKSKGPYCERNSI